MLSFASSIKRLFTRCHLWLSERRRLHGAYRAAVRHHDLREAAASE